MINWVSVEAIIIIIGGACFGLTSAFSITNWLTISVVGTLLVAGVSVSRISDPKYLRTFGNPNVVLAIGMCLVILLSFAFSLHEDQSKLFSHTMARLFSVIFYFVLPYTLLASDSTYAHFLKRGLIAAALVVFGLIAYDKLLLAGILNWGVVPHLGLDEELGALARGSIYRARGGGFEPGHDASVIAAILPLLVDRFRGATVIAVTTIIVGTYFLGYSVALLLWYAVFILIFAAMANDGAFRLSIRNIIRSIALFIFAFIVGDAFDFFDDLISKLESDSYWERSVSFSAILSGVLDNFASFLFGYGPGGYLILGVGVVTNTYAGFALDIGIVGLTLYLLLIVSTLSQLIKQRASLYIASFIAYSLSFPLTIGNYWFPTHWIFLLYPFFAKLNATSINETKNKKLY